MLLLRRPSGRGARGSPTESRRPAQPPRANEELLVGVFPVQVVGPLPRVQGSQRQRPPAARRAARPHSASGGRAPRRPRRREAASRGAGRTMERGAGPAGAPRPRRQRPPRRPPEAGGLIHPPASPPGPTRSAGLLPPPRRPPPEPPLRAARRRPLRPSPELAERRVGGGWVWGSAAVPTRFSSFPSGRLCPRPLWSGCLPYLHPTLHTLSLPAPPPLPTSESENLRPSVCFYALVFVFFLMAAEGSKLYLQVTSESGLLRLTHGYGLLFSVKCRSPVTTSWLYKTKQVLKVYSGNIRL